MFGLGLPEMAVILVVLLLVFGPSRLPGMGKGIGEALRGFKKAMSGDDEQASVSEPKQVKT